jgi:membrane-anchored protein YejM (alkaline phosphatase superfamily)
VNRKIKLGVVAWILIFLAFNLHFAFPLKDVFLFLTEVPDINAIQMVQQAITLMSFVFGEIGLIVVLIAVIVKSPSSEK